MKKSKLINKRLGELTISLQNLSDKINSIYQNKDVLKSADDGQPQILLIDAFEEYYKHLYNYNTPSHIRVERERTYTSRLFRAVGILKREIIGHGIDVSAFKVSDINDEVVGWFYEGLAGEHFANVTYNSIRAYINTFEIWLIEKGYLKKRYFVKLKRKTAISNSKAITQSEYHALLRLIINEPGECREMDDVRYRDYYQTWLVTGIQLGLETGGRMEDIINFKFSNIIEDGGKPAYIKIEDFKYNVIKKLVTNKEKKYKAIPISANLLIILMESGYSKKKGTDEFVLAGDITSPSIRKHGIPRILRNGFSHYYSKLNTGRPLSFKSLRKAYITSSYIQTGGHPEYLSGHDSGFVPINHYVDKDEIAKYHTQMGYTVFPEAVDLPFFERISKVKKVKIQQHLKNVSSITLNKDTTTKALTEKVFDRDAEAMLHEKSKKAIFSENDPLIGIIQGNHPIIVLKPLL